MHHCRRMKNNTTHVDSWGFFDKIYCISLVTRPDRREQAQKEFAGVGLLQRVEFILVDKHPENQEKGIFESHMSCLEKGLSAGAKNILVFEDDVFFKGFSGQALHEACSNVGSASWDGLFLGCITDKTSKTGKKNLVKITYRCLAHAYVLNRHFAEKIIKETWSGIPFDELLRRRNAAFYALYPMCAFQGMAGSDNQTVVIDRVRRIFGGLPFIQKANEVYQNNKTVLRLAPLVGLFALTFLVYRLW